MADAREDDDPRLSDEATGLPPLGVVDPTNTCIGLAWDASEGLVYNPHTDQSIPVRYLHVRGLYNEDDGKVMWGQCFIAVPVDVALEVAAALAKGTMTNLDDPNE